MADFNETIYNDPVPNIDWSGHIWQSYDSLAGDPSSIVLKTASETALSGEILPLLAPTTNSSYDIQFFGPSLQCGPSNQSQSLAFKIYTNQSMIQRAVVSFAEVNSSYWNNYTSQIPNTSALAWWAYSGFSPNLFRGNPDLNAEYNVWDVELGDVPTNQSTTLMDPGTQQLWVQLLDRNFVCQLVSSTFTIEIDHSQGSQRVIQRKIEWLNNFHVSEFEDPLKRFEDNAYVATFAALVSILNGNVSFSTMGQVVDHSSQILQTKLLACPELNLTALELRVANLSVLRMGQITDFSAYLPTQGWQCPSNSLERAIEELANNVTISMLTSPYLT